MQDKNGRISGLIGISRDITRRIKAEEDLQKANTQLTDQVAQMALLNELEEQLQACLVLDEVFQVASHLVPRLFPATSGALYVINNSRNWVEPSAVWGAQPPDSQAFGLEDCWALRRGRTHLSGHDHGNLACRHISPPLPAFSACLPLLAQGETQGVLHLRTASDSAPYQWDASYEQLARVIADSVALALANLKLRETLRQQSIRDPLTELFNRRYMEESLEREIMRAARAQRSVGIIMIDVDHFKKLNDSRGHDFGDSVLRQLGRFLKERTRGGDIACRYGGEEFTLILPEANLDQTRQRAEQHLREFVTLPVPHNGLYFDPPTLSLGVATYPDHGTSGAMVLKAADTALYHAKHEGRNQVVVYGDFVKSPNPE
jgi:diguanylate cyclase (GGDEF)-like protein